MLGILYLIKHKITISLLHLVDMERIKSLSLHIRLFGRLDFCRRMIKNILKILRQFPCFLQRMRLYNVGRIAIDFVIKISIFKIKIIQNLQ